MPCENAAQSNDYFEFIGEYSGVLDYVKDSRSHMSKRTDGHPYMDKIIHIIRFHVVSV